MNSPMLSDFQTIISRRSQTRINKIDLGITTEIIKSRTEDTSHITPISNEHISAENRTDLENREDGEPLANFRDLDCSHLSSYRCTNSIARATLIDERCDDNG